MALDTSSPSRPAQWPDGIFIMSEILVYYERVSPTTWVYLSSLLIIALFFKFNRLWSVRNLDLIGLILLAPGLLFVIYGQEKEMLGYEQAGYIWLFIIDGLFLVRMLLDPMMVRRPLLEPNLSVGGMTFLGLSLLVFLMANVVTDKSAVKQLKTDAASMSAPAEVAVESKTDHHPSPTSRRRRRRNNRWCCMARAIPGCLRSSNCRRDFYLRATTKHS